MTDMQWWTPDGWQTSGPPGAWVEATHAGERIDWQQATSGAGYHEMCRFGNTIDYETNVGIGVHTCEHDQHLLVEISAADYPLAEFFVSAQHRVPFLVDRLPQLVSAWSGQLLFPNLAEEVRRLRKAVVAFVRHGSGEHVIDENGEMSLEDLRELAERRQEVARAKAAKAQAR